MNQNECECGDPMCNGIEYGVGRPRQGEASPRSWLSEITLGEWSALTLSIGTLLAGLLFVQL